MQDISGDFYRCPVCNATGDRNDRGNIVQHTDSNIVNLADRRDALRNKKRVEPVPPPTGGDAA